jgi:antitoxin component YwqK of YwqJK toxin-antitoxin module
VGAYDNGQKSFTGSFADGEPQGKHRWYWPNGRLKLEGRFRGGAKHGDFNYFDEDGRPLLTITYRNGMETRLDNEKLPPPFEPGGSID